MGCDRALSSGKVDTLLMSSRVFRFAVTDVTVYPQRILRNISFGCSWLSDLMHQTRPWVVAPSARVLSGDSAVFTCDEAATTPPAAELADSSDYINWKSKPVA